MVGDGLLYLNIQKEILQIKSSPPVLLDYDQELQQLWTENLVSTKSDVLCDAFNRGYADSKDVKVIARTARIYTDKKYCECPCSKPGKIADPSEHLPSCRFSKSKHKTEDILIPTNLPYWNSLGLAL